MYQLYHGVESSLTKMFTQQKASKTKATRMKTILILLSILTLTNCTQEIQIDGFDAAAFKLDKHACTGTRLKLEPQLIEAQEQLKGYNQIEITKLLGKPDKIEIYKRGQRFFIYFLEKGPSCSNEKLEKYPKSLFIRFSALNSANEVFIKEY